MSEAVTEKSPIETTSIWSNSQDVLKLNNLTIKANYSTWEVAKKQSLKSTLSMPIYIHATYPAGVTLKEAKQLRDYLNEKIEYLEA